MCKAVSAAYSSLESALDDSFCFHGLISQSFDLVVWLSVFAYMIPPENVILERVIPNRSWNDFRTGPYFIKNANRQINYSFALLFWRTICMTKGIEYIHG